MSSLTVKPSLEKRRTDYIHSVLDKAEEFLVDHPIDPGRLYFMRPSGFPYCGLRYLLTYEERATHGNTSDLASHYFTSVGHAAHTVFQDYVGKVAPIIGDWKCPDCKTVNKFSVYKTCKCGGKPKYEEIEVVYKGTILGHLDGLILLKSNKKRDRYIVIDYKTATKSKIEKGQKDETIFPYGYNVQQIKRYVVLLELCFNIKVEGWALIYLNRDVPLGRKNRKVVYKKVPKEEKAALKTELNVWIENHRRTLKAKSRKDFDLVAKNKLCSSYSDYMQNWHNDYSPCPCRPYCFNEKQLTKKLDSKSGSKIFPIVQHIPDYILKRLSLNV